MKIKKGLYILLIFVLSGTILFSGYKVISILSEYKKGENSYGDITNKYTQNIEISEILQEEQPKAEKAPISVDFEALLEECADVIGWIYCPDTPINYPIVQAKDNDYYLRRLLDGTWNMAGSIFMDYRNAPDFTDFNTVIYGHNMKNNSMFTSLGNYKNQEYYEEHPVIYLLTPNKDYKLELIGGYFVNVDETDVYSIPAAEEEMDALIEKAKQNSTFESKAAINGGDRIVTLSTCTDNFDDTRYVVIGVLQELSK